MPKVFSDHQSWYAATLSSISDDLHHTSTIATIPKLIYTYNSVTHGFCASLSSSQLELLKQSPGFIYSIRDVPVKAHSTHTSKFLGLNSNFGAWPETNYGKDVIIGVIDSGVWPESESFRDHGMTKIPSKWRGKCVSDISFNSSMCNKKLIGARFYNKGIINNIADVNITVNSTRDDDGHGTHTSSIAAGNYVEGASFFGYAQGTSKGIAPHARLAIYKAIWDYHGSASDVIAAIDQAIEDGVDILSISMNWVGNVLYEDPIAIASFAAMQKGIFVATSAGNGGSILFSVGNGAPWVLTVGGSSVDRTFSGTITLGNGVSVIGESLYLGSSLSLPLVYMSKCFDWEALKKVGHKIVVCVGGQDYDLPDIIEDVKTAHVAGAIFICRTNHMEKYIQSSFPATFVNHQDGQPILDYLNKSTDPKVTLEFYKTEIGTRPAPIVGEYSGRGPSASCPSVLKPDLVAPGTTILASWPPNIPVTQPGLDVMFSPFNILSGTSMACPHAAGVAALLKGKHPEWSPAAIRSAMMTTADVLDNNLNPVKDFAYDFGDLPPASSLAMGAGHINPNKALDPGLIYDAKAEDYVRFLCSTNFTKNQIRMITRSTPLNCSNPSSDINYPSFIAFFNASKSSPITQSVQEFRRTLTNVGDGMSTYIANLTQMNEVTVSVVPKKLVFRRKYETLSFTLTIKGPTRLNDMAVDGSISWIDVKGKHVVRSPIVATRLNFDDIEG
ncbi:hypothetical protein AQUCO_01500039v1 [Aquilegia coerulea]|uniref:Subtilisin-like protease fibronectin type-III domain-containing protein n=1 Tax=Aquilegia coerulea TaxID=218851 RepID=A0A2G5DSL6_AQUCA|nr:hypothetical protein AQUCO_01500039v1 [Aquilegia coerulea]